MGALTVEKTEAQQTPFLQWSVAELALRGQKASGDLHVVRALDQGVLVAVIDGLGHGEEAQHAARLAAATIAQHQSQSVIDLVRRCHSALIGTRGCAMSIAAINASDETMTWLAIGNVEAVLVRPGRTGPSARETVVMRGGVIGYDLPVLRATVTTLSAGDLLVFATDGIRPEFIERLAKGPQDPRELADHVMAQYAKHTDDSLVFVGRYLGKERHGG